MSIGETDSVRNVAQTFRVFSAAVSSPIEVGHRVRELRLRAELTQTELAARAEIKQGTLSKIERGETKNTEAETLLRLAIALNASAFYLMWGNRQPERLDESIASLAQIWHDLDLHQRAKLLAYAQGLIESAPAKPAPKPEIRGGGVGKGKPAVGGVTGRTKGGTH